MCNNYAIQYSYTPSGIWYKYETLKAWQIYSDLDHDLIEGGLTLQKILHAA